MVMNPEQLEAMSTDELEGVLTRNMLGAVLAGSLFFNSLAAIFVGGRRLRALHDLEERAAAAAAAAAGEDVEEGQGEEADDGGGRRDDESDVDAGDEVVEEGEVVEEAEEPLARVGSRFPVEILRRHA